MGRWSKERHAQEAAKKAESAAQSPQAESVEPSEPQTDPEFGRVRTRNEPRNQAFEEVVSRHNKTSGMETEEPAETKEEPKTEPVAEAPKEPVAEPAPEPVSEAPAAPVVTKQVVDGKEYEVPQSEIEEAGGAANWRKQKAADNRLAEAKETLAESKRTQAQMVQYLQSLAQHQPQQPNPQQIEFNRFLQEKMAYIRQGTDDQATQALHEILTRAVPQINPVAIQNQTILEMKRHTAADKFKEEFPEITSNPSLMTFASSLENARLAQVQQTGAFNDPRTALGFDWNLFYRSIGNEIRGATRQSQPVTPQVQTPSNPSAVTEKEARKASTVVSLPTAASRAELPKEEKPETREDILNSMRKKRGLHTG
jgi:hypothetical protein